MFKRHLINDSTGFEEMGGENYPVVLSLKSILAPQKTSNQMLSSCPKDCLLYDFLNYIFKDLFI